MKNKFVSYGHRKENTVDSEYKAKLETYQKLKEEYLCQKTELAENGLEQKSLTDPDSRRMKIMALWIFVTMYNL